MVRSESVQEQGGAKEGSVSQGESGRKGEPITEKQASGAGTLFEHEIDGERVLMSKEAWEEMQSKKKSKRPILPPVSIREPTPQPQKTVYQKLWREKEEQNKLGKGKEKMPEYCISGTIWTESTELDQEEANALMVDYRESTLHNQDGEFNRMIEEVMKEPSETLTQTSTLLMIKIVSVCVKINEEKRWAIDVYLDT